MAGQELNNRFQDRTRKMTAGIEPWRRGLERVTAIGHDMSKRLVRVRERIALSHLDHSRKGVGNRRRNGYRAPFSFIGSPVLEMIEHSRELGREGIGTAEQEAIIRATMSFAPLGIVALGAAQKRHPCRH